MQYQILTATNPDDLEQKVNKLLKEGWQPTGGLTVAQMQISYRPDSETPKWATTISIWSQAIIYNR